MRPPNEKPAPTGKEGSGLKTQSAGKPDADYTTWDDLGNADHDIIRDALDVCFEEHFVHAPKALKDRFYQSASPRLAGEDLVHLARARFGTHNFEFDPDGRWAIVAPIYDDGEPYPVDLGAFDVADENMRRAYRGKGFAVGLPSALLDARFHPENRANIHADVWSWLRCECTGVLPIDWRLTELELQRHQIAGLIADNHDQARKVQRLRAALKPPPLFVRRERVAA